MGGYYETEDAAFYGRKIWGRPIGAAVFGHFHGFAGSFPFFPVEYLLFAGVRADGL